MAQSYASGTVDASPDEVWNLVSRFDAMSEWHPMVVESELLEGGGPRAVGALRRQVLSTGGVAHARLVTLDDASRTLTYEMLDGPFKVRNYLSTIRVFPITLEGGSFVEWWGTYDVDEKNEGELADTFGEGVYAAGVRALQSWFARPEAAKVRAFSSEAGH